MFPGRLVSGLSFGVGILVVARYLFLREFLSEVMRNRGVIKEIVEYIRNIK